MCHDNYRRFFTNFILFFHLGQGCFFSGKKIKGHSSKHEMKIFIEDKPDDKKWYKISKQFKVS